METTTETKTNPIIEYRTRRVLEICGELNRLYPAAAGGRAFTLMPDRNDGYDNFRRIALNPAAFPLLAQYTPEAEAGYIPVITVNHIPADTAAHTEHYHLRATMHKDRGTPDYPKFDYRKDVEINVSHKKTPAQIAKEIQRRILNTEFLQDAAYMLADVRDCLDGNAKTNAMLKELKAILPDAVKQDRSDSTPERVWFNSVHLRAQGEIRSHCDGKYIEIKVDGLTPDQARAILAIIATGPKRDE